jgi:transcriptional regulator with XRE-family HTH domain
MTDADILTRIKAERVKAGLSMAEVAKRLEMSTKGYEHIEYGRRRLTLEVYVRIADAVGFNPGRMLNKVTQGK